MTAKTVLFSALWLLAAAGRSTPEGPVLKGRVISNGAPLPGATVHLRGDDFDAVRLADDQGAFEFQLSPGTFELEASLVGYHTILIRDLEITERPAEALTVWLPRLLAPPEEPLVKVPASAPAPPLEIRWRLEPAPVAGQTIAGVVTLVNLGPEPLPLPTKPRDFGKPIDKRSLFMNLTVASPQYGAAFNGWYECVPANDCQTIPPSGEVSFRIVLVDVSDPERPATYGSQGGEFVFIAAASFVPPDAEDVRTEPVTNRYLFRLPPFP